MCKKLFYLISLVLLLAVSVQVQAEVIFSDDFDQAVLADWSRVNYQGWYEDVVLGWPNPGGDWVIGDWDGYQSLPDPDTGVSPTVLAYNYVDTFNIGMGEPNQPQAFMPFNQEGDLNGVLRITSVGSFWEHAGNTGPFLYKMVEGDFVAQVEVVSYDYFYNNMGGLMARDPNPDPNENWTQVCIFPLYSIGNRVNDTTEGTTSWLGTKGYPSDPYLQLERIGNTFYYYTSPDGVTYSSLMTADPDDPNSPMIPLAVDRPDLPAELQVGIFQANFAPDWICNMDFDNFSIETVSEAAPPMIAHWPLDEGAGTTAADVVGGNDGTLVGGVTWLADGGAAFDNIDGSHIEVPHADVLDFADESFTISMLVRYDAHPGDTDRWIIKGTHGDPGTGSRYEIFQTDGDQIRFAIDNGPDNIKSSLRPEGTNAAIITGDWVHVVAVRDAENDLMSLYADGVLLGTLADTSGDISNGEDMFIGESTDETTTAMAGDMADVRIYDVALTEDQIASIY